MDDLMEYPSTDVPRPRSPLPLVSAYSDEAPAEPQVDQEEWEDDPPQSDGHRTEQQDEEYELYRWASWRRPVSEIKESMRGDGSFGVSPPLDEFFLGDMAFFAAYETEEDADRKAVMHDEYWRRKDRDWCFACAYSISEDQVRLYAPFDKIQRMLEA